MTAVMMESQVGLASVPCADMLEKQQGFAFRTASTTTPDSSRRLISEQTAGLLVEDNLSAVLL